MTNECVVIGCGAHASSVISIIESSTCNYNVVGLVDLAEGYDSTEDKSGYKVILSLGELLSNYDKYSNLHCVLAIGDNIKRAAVFKQLINNNFKVPNIIANSAFVDRTVHMGIGNIIAHGSFINAKASLGSNNLINSYAVIEHHCTIKNHTHIAPKALLCGGVDISDFGFIGAGAIVIPNLCVEKKVIVGAGSVLTTNITEEQVTFVGVPAKMKIK